MYQKTTILCCNGPRCPVVTQSADDQYNIVDDFGNTDTFTREDLTQLAALGACSQDNQLVKYRNVQMLGEQAALAMNAI